MSLIINVLLYGFIIKLNFCKLNGKRYDFKIIKEICSSKETKHFFLSKSSEKNKSVQDKVSYEKKSLQDWFFIKPRLYLKEKIRFSR